MLVAGMDVGSVAAKAVILEALPDGGSRVAGRAVLPTGWDTRGAGREALRQAASAAGAVPEDMAFTVATGYGRVSLPFADRCVTEISCHARGAAHGLPAAGLVLDIGGQDSKAIALDTDAGRSGSVRDFLMNDKCAAGAGRFLQMISGILGLSLEEMDAAAAAGTPAEISSMCAVFAETEIVGLLARGTAPEDIAAGVLQSLARRTCALARRLSSRGECVFTGGLALCPSLVAALARELGHPVHVPEHPQCAGALGAALFALDAATRTAPPRQGGES